MTKIIQIIALIAIGTGATFTMFYPITLPAEMVEIVADIIYGLWLWEGILPIEALFNTIYIIIFVLFGWMCFKIIMNLLGSNQDMDG